MKKEKHFNLLVYAHLMLLGDTFTNNRCRHWFISGVQSSFSFQKRFDVELQPYRTLRKVQRIVLFLFFWRPFQFVKSRSNKQRKARDNGV